MPAQAAAWLARGRPGRGPLDLSDTLVIVPTRQAGRRLREALAEHAAARGAAAFPPRVQTPDTLLAAADTAPGTATRLEALLAWTAVLRAVDPAEVPDVLPAPPARRDFAWAWRLAETFFRLQTQLAEGGLAFADVAARYGADFPETERWRQLAELERRQVAGLADCGRREPHAARRAFAAAPELPPGVTRVVLLAVPDPLPLALAALAQLADRVAVEVAVYAPESEAENFDAWGRPDPARWEQRELGWPDFARRVRLCADPAAMAERAIATARAYLPAPDGLVALGAADPEALPLLESAGARAGVTTYPPEGRARNGGRLHTLLSALAALAREPSFEAVAALARCPDFLAGLAARRGADGDPARWLRELDALRAQRLPATLAGARRRATGEARAGLDFMAELHAALGRGAFPENAVAALGAVFGDRRFDLATEADRRLADEAAAWRDAMRACRDARAVFPDLTPAEWWEAALRLFGESRHTEAKTPGALDLQGWLELLWEDAPHLVVAGLNDGLVPEAVAGDAFLPESLRARLGLKTNAARFARDAYLLQALAAARADGGRLDVLFAKTSAAGDPLRPSRLFLRCPDPELPARVALLFREPAAAHAQPAWRRAWPLRPGPVEPPARVAVTGLRTWLACPFRFYLAQVRRMEPVDPAKSELDARDFGTLCHAALEAMALEPALRDCTDEAELREFLTGRLERQAQAMFGGELTLPLLVQFESARQRLGRAAAVQARDRAAGWVFERAEWKFTLDLGGLEVRGKIDRIDRHEATGARRVLDYKTSDTAVSPARAHLRAARAEDDVSPDWMRTAAGGRDEVWTDLQLPLYLRALAAEAAGPAACGYFNLPKAAGETAIELWDGLTPELLDAAHACADGVAAAIRAGDYWPPRELPADRDTFGALFHHGAGASVAWEGRR